MRGGINHVALTVRDLQGAERSFYRPVLEFLGYEQVEAAEGMTLWFNGSAGVAFNLWQASDGLRDRTVELYAPGFHHCAFSVESREAVDALHELLKRQSIRVIDAPAEYPQYSPGYYAVYFQDPDGLKFEAVHMPVIPD